MIWYLWNVSGGSFFLLVVQYPFFPSFWYMGAHMTESQSGMSVAPPSLATVIGPSIGTRAESGHRPCPGLSWLKLTGKPLFFFFIMVPYYKNVA